MKKRVSACVLALAMCAFVLVTAAPASADTTCSIVTQGSSTGLSPTHIRKCRSDVVVGGAHFNGAVWWYFDGDCPRDCPVGLIFGEITDTTADGDCAQVWVRHFDTNGVRDANRRVQQACGKGVTQNMPDDGSQYFNFLPTGRFRSGVWKVFIISGASSGRIFQEAVTATP